MIKKIFNRPILAYVIFTAGSMIISNIFDIIPAVLEAFTGIRDPGVTQIVVCFLMLLVFKLCNRPYFRGFLSFRGFKTFLIYLLAPVLIFSFINVSNATFGGVDTIIKAIIMALSAGVAEEVMFRGLGIANWMRIRRDDKAIVQSMVVSGLIFGLMHITNVFFGANLLTSVGQVIYAIGLGMLFAAVYIRTGNLWLGIIAHFIIDFTAFLDAGLVASEGVMTQEINIPSLIFTGIIGIFAGTLAVICLRKKKRPDITALWDNIWSGRSVEDLAGLDSEIDEVGSDPA
ncbi:MAG: CPBP family intramembrane metalloprotease [Eubacteriales bacterium]|nr:CPBP family intramembrane metalloprotease [Eubacteriales bacterium]